MNRRKIISLLTVLVIILNMILPTLSFALETGVAEVKVVPSKTEVKRGEEITVSVHLNTNGAKGITLTQIYMSYDPDILEPVGEPTLNSEFSSIIPAGTDPRVSINENLNRLNFLWTSGANQFELVYNEDLCTATFKVKEDAVLGPSSITIEDNQPVGGMNPNTGEIVDVQYAIVDSEVDVILPVNSISLDKTELDLTVPEEGTLNVIYNPEDTTEKEITWESSDNNVATVESTEDGVATVKSVGKGTATIKATAKNGATAECTVNVTKLVPIESIELSETEVALDRGESKQITATALPQDTTDDKTITWTSSKDSVATVEQDGTITAVDKGTAIITATATNGVKAECVVTVGVPLESISFEGDITDKVLDRDETLELKVIYNPDDTDTDKTIKWSSSNTAVAKVENGIVTAIDDGEAEITATSVNGKTATCKIKVVVPLKSISIKESTSIKCGETEKLEVTYNPNDTTDDKTIKWTSLDEGIATVSTDGTVTAKQVGNTTITASTLDGKLTAECKVEVLPVPLESIQIKEQNITLNKGTSQDLTVIYNPENTTESKDIDWTSSNPEFVTVDENGKITAVANGTVTITAKVGTQEATTTVTVKTPLESISITEEKVILNRPETIDLDVIYNPDDTTDDRTVTWTSSNEDVATVDEDGVVTPVAPGTAYIKAKVGDKEASCEVEVKVPLKGITIKEETELLKGKYEELTVTYNPADATYEGKVTWESSDPEVATVDENGKITALKEGTTKITATAEENGVKFTDECTVTVKEIKMDSIVIDSADFELGLGREKQLNVNFYPEDTTDDRTITWKSSNPEVATVDENGVVKAVKIGTAVITATTADGKTNTVEVTVKEIPIESIEISAPTTVKVGDSFTLEIAINPSDATKQDGIKYISSNSEVIEIDENGKVLAKGVGTAIITVEAENGVKNQIEITVENQNINIDGENLNGDTNTTNSPKTGDIAIELFVGLMIVSALGIAFILIKNKRK